MILHLVTSAKALLGCKVAYSQVQGLGCGHLWRWWVALFTTRVPGGEDKDETQMAEKFPEIQVVVFPPVFYSLSSFI